MNDTNINEKDTRETIIEAAKTLFMTHGYRAVSTRMIAKDCGITQPALYHHFSDKQALYTEVLKYSLLDMKCRLNKIYEEITLTEECLTAMAVEILL
ncbi:MAG: TetR/AcrR family transcriptional regulator, partial [Bacilli bacterium]